MASDNDQERRWLAIGETFLRSARAADEPAVPGGRLYQFGIYPAFTTPCLLAFDDRIDGIDASVTIVGSVGIEYQGVAAVPTGHLPLVRSWSASLLGRAPDDRHKDWRDGLVCFVRVIGCRQLAWTWIENPSLDHHPMFAAALADMAGVALQSFQCEPVRSYLANVLRPLLRPHVQPA